MHISCTPPFHIFHIIHLESPHERGGGGAYLVHSFSFDGEEILDSGLFWQRFTLAGDRIDKSQSK